MSNAMFYQLADELCAIIDSESIATGAVRITKTRNDGVTITYDTAMVYMGIVSDIDYDILRRLLALHKRVAELDESMVIAVRTIVSEMTNITYGTYYLPCNKAMYGMGVALVAKSMDVLDELLMSGAEAQDIVNHFVLAYSQHYAHREQAYTVTEASETMGYLHHQSQVNAQQAEKRRKLMNTSSDALQVILQHGLSHLPLDKVAAVKVCDIPEGVEVLFDGKRVWMGEPSKIDLGTVMDVMKARHEGQHHEAYANQALSNAITELFAKLNDPVNELSLRTNLHVGIGPHMCMIWYKARLVDRVLHTGLFDAERIADKLYRCHLLYDDTTEQGSIHDSVVAGVRRCALMYDIYMSPWSVSVTSALPGQITVAVDGKTYYNGPDDLIRTSVIAQLLDIDARSNGDRYVYSQIITSAMREMGSSGNHYGADGTLTPAMVANLSLLCDHLNVIYNDDASGYVIALTYPDPDTPADPYHLAQVEMGSADEHDSHKNVLSAFRGNAQRVGNWL